MGVDFRAAQTSEANRAVEKNGQACGELIDNLAGGAESNRSNTTSRRGRRSASGQGGLIIAPSFLAAAYNHPMPHILTRSGLDGKRKP